MSGNSMKAVAGTLSAVREMPVEDDEELEDSLPVPSEFLPVIERCYGLMGSTMAELAKQTSCFGHLWEDEEGPCPEASKCDVAKHCKAVFLEVTTEELEEEVLEEEIEQDLTVEEELDKELAEEEPAKAPEMLSSGLRSKSRKAKKGITARTPRGKYKGTGKYTRHGYFDMGRPVDASIRRLMHELDYPEELPKNWSSTAIAAKYPNGGVLLVARTASYHSIIVGSALVCRAWTNAAGYSLVDLSPLLVAKLKTLNVPVTPLPAKSKDAKKYHAFAGRYYMKSEEDAERLANWIKQSYKLGAPPPAPKKSKKKTVTRKGKLNA